MRKNENRKFRSCYPQLSRLLRTKILFRELGRDMLRNPRRESQTHRFQGEREKTNATSVGSQAFQMRMS
jgi:hypothetical protein